MTGGYPEGQVRVAHGEERKAFQRKNWIAGVGRGWKLGWDPLVSFGAMCVGTGVCLTPLQEGGTPEILLSDALHCQLPEGISQQMRSPVPKPRPLPGQLLLRAEEHGV